MKEIKPANRINNVSEYYFSVKLKEIAKMNEDGADVINLGIGSPDLPPAPEVISALAEDASDPKGHGYQPYIGTPQLRRAFADLYKKWYNTDLNPDNEILPLIGSKEGIMHISMAFVNEGDSVLVPNPGYPTYSSVSRLVGANIITYSLDEQNSWEPDFDDLERRDATGEIDLSSVRLMWCNYPNMPTGANANITLFERLVSFGKKHNIIICHDNPYSFILNDKPLSIFMAEGAKEICIELNSLSKSHNMPGWRIGMVASNPQFIGWILRVKSNMDSGMFRPLQMAAATALSLPDSWYKGMNDVYRKRRALAGKILQSVGAKFESNQVGLFLWGKIEGQRGVDLCDEILYNAKVFITPGFIFGSNGENYIRVSLCADEATLERALQRIENYNSNK